MLSPKKSKYRKHHKGKMRGRSIRGSTIMYGDYALQATTCGWVSSRQIEAARVAISRSCKKGGNVWIRIFPDKVITKKPAEVRMGSGKGAPDHWVAVVRPGRILFEVGGLDRENSLIAMRMAKYKLPVQTKILSKVDMSPKAKVSTKE
ncbi:MAG: 50S ribosomal protein L16 [Pseudomonadota bacterium]